MRKPNFDKFKIIPAIRFDGPIIFVDGNTMKNGKHIGSDETGDGSANKPYLTLQKAIEVLPKNSPNRTQISIRRTEIKGEITIDEEASAIFRKSICDEIMRIKMKEKEKNNGKV